MIHNTDPFATPEHARSPVRRLRGRLPAAVTLWTATDSAGEPAGLTVSSTLVVDGQPGRLLGLLDVESELWAAASAAGRFAVAALGPAQRQLADRFAGVLPAPGGLFRGYEWIDTAYGPVPAGGGSGPGGTAPASGGAWAGCRLDGSRPFGWGLLVEATIERIELGEDAPPLVYYRGRYRELG
jgi:3-hydroxy-9,10-secoandrosta-1,3,5(10)-triene-9,17-dione monooxygenase reductase component